MVFQTANKVYIWWRVAGVWLVYVLPQRTQNAAALLRAMQSVVGAAAILEIWQLQQSMT